MYLANPCSPAVIDAMQTGTLGYIDTPLQGNADAIGCDSVDGTYLTFGPDANLPKLLAWVRNNDQGALFGGVA